MNLISTRFSDETWNENKQFRERNNYNCIYGIPIEFQSLHYDCNLFIIEMNNTQNRIEGIGLIRNRPNFEKTFNIHTDKNYNRFVYKGYYHLNRDVIIQYSSKLIEILEYILFKEKNHVKRSMGFTLLTQKYIKKKKKY
jgi:hypothetical protein